jgi:UV DNA damage endonuclease
MHPDQFILLNTTRPEVLERSVRELEYHCLLMDEMELAQEAKIQIHVGGVYGDKNSAVGRLCRQYDRLSGRLRRRLVIENDHKMYGLEDCLSIHREIGVPVLLDIFHHECLNRGEGRRAALEAAAGTWRAEDGLPMVDYSTQQPGKRPGVHAETIDLSHFGDFLTETSGLEFDIMLEIKDKEASALKAVALLDRSRAG